MALVSELLQQQCMTECAVWKKRITHALGKRGSSDRCQRTQVSQTLISACWPPSPCCCNGARSFPTGARKTPVNLQASASIIIMQRHESLRQVPEKRGLQPELSLKIVDHHPLLTAMARTSPDRCQGRCQSIFKRRLHSSLCSGGKSPTGAREMQNSA